MASIDERNKTQSYPRVYLTIARMNKGISGEELSRKLDITKSYYYSIENGKRGNKLTVILFAKIIAYLDADVKEMLTKELNYIKERNLFLKDKRKIKY